MRKLFTSESVTEGHPDKICDQISDTILDAILTQDPVARVACEVAATTDFLLVMGEITSLSTVDIDTIARSVIRDIGYVRPDLGFCADTCTILQRIGQQSPDIAMGVNRSLEAKSDGSEDTGAGDQGMMFGFACNDTEELMPLPISLSHALTRRLADQRKSGAIPYLLPDGKAQVTVAYDDCRASAIETVVVSTQHDEHTDMETLRRDIMEKVIIPALPGHLLTPQTQYFINPTGRFVVGGPHGDSGLTGRKIIVDTYGGYARHGGGAFSGKDPTKVDRSAAYAARYVAKNIVKAGLAEKCEVALSYVIGVAHPVQIVVETWGTGVVSDERLSQLARKYFDLRPRAILETLQLQRPIYRPVSCYGHFGRKDLDLSWEKTDKAELLKKDA
ncbi:MAG: methionine adenosyltransferase [Christensenellales bacterium]